MEQSFITASLVAQTGDLRDTGSISGFGRFPGEGHGYPLQYSCLEKLMDRGPWKATVHRVPNANVPKMFVWHWEEKGEEKIEINGRILYGCISLCSI